MVGLLIIVSEQGVSSALHKPSYEADATECIAGHFILQVVVEAASANNLAACHNPVCPQQQHSSAKHVLSATCMHQLHSKAVCSRRHKSGRIPACGRLTSMKHVPPARIGVGPLAGAVDKVACLPVDGAPTILLQQPSRPGAIADALMGARAALHNRNRSV